MFRRLFGKKEKLTVPDFKMPSDEELTTTGSGLQYVAHEKGDGVPPGSTDTVTVHYCGWTLSGQKFDSSFDRGETISFPLNGVIAGWTEGLQLMSPGARYTFVIPANLAYGQRGAPPSIGPNETLVFLVELHSVS
ncbi:MAG: FKBP-type peptidyl-prolyl cis-trans isomerase, partial [Candidatus Paceibacteria bacterium]|jgi:FKBP-type peptidyl-prolyl cis-trans isomerase